MKPQFRHIIRGAKVEGVSAYRDSSLEERKTKPRKGGTSLKNFSQLEKILQGKVKEEGVKALERIWQEAERDGHQKGLREGQALGFQTGKEQGVEIGLEKGRKEAQAKLEKTLNLLTKIIEQFSHKKEELLEQAKPEIIKFSLAVCEKVLRQELSNPRVFKELIENLLAQAMLMLKEAPVNVVLSPTDSVMLEKDLKPLRHDRQKKINVVSDSSIPPGNCCIESSLGLINFDVNRLLEELEKRVLEFEAE